MSEPEHQMARPPTLVYDADGQPVGYLATCTCDGAVFYEGGTTESKDKCWETLAGHTVLANPEFAAIAERVSRERSQG